jgi:hypothetical protein
LEVDSDLYEPFDRLVEIEILGKQVSVPNNNPLLRCFQYLSLHSISMGDFCWNGDCANCQIWYRLPGDAAERERTALSCRTNVIEGMMIVRIAAEVKMDGITE